ncbi:hypothetical protein ACQP3C_27725, partial [Escherichia coli]
KSLIYHVCHQDQEFLLSPFFLFLNFLEGEGGGGDKGRAGYWEETWIASLGSSPSLAICKLDDLEGSHSTLNLR